MVALLLQSNRRQASVCRPSNRNCDPDRPSPAVDCNSVDFLSPRVIRNAAVGVDCSFCCFHGNPAARRGIASLLYRLCACWVLHRSRLMATCAGQPCPRHRPSAPLPRQRNSVLRASRKSGALSTPAGRSGANVALPKHQSINPKLYVRNLVGDSRSDPLRSGYNLLPRHETFCIRARSAASAASSRLTPCRSRTRLTNPAHYFTRFSPQVDQRSSRNLYLVHQILGEQQ